MGEAQTEHDVHQEHEKLVPVRALADQHALTVARDRGGKERRAPVGALPQASCPWK
ncbi:hypothetical protein [Streptomyces sp. NBC_01237]|uniref:hypothetical protein n=1 Tax=Streptomyces sp. NBC_01237 TaxID=2903790 RepID=UPI002DD99287|nr:hypothetical protein [Streptomyces sp. NBC_01237]WRZ70172.1 hypothetical protein OG251_00085 [Streptomyces sp. NBC_01237]